LHPLVTAIVTTRTRPQHVYEALASVCAETYQNVESVVVDDGGTFDLAGAGSERPIRVVRSEMRGVAGARNVGLAEARGEFVIFLDDDDVAMPSRIATLVDAAGRYRADLCFGMTQRVAAHAVGKLSAVPTNVRAFGLVGLCDVLTCAPHINAVLVRTAALRAIGGFDSEAAHFDDWSAWIRLADQGVRMCCVSDLVAEWRLHDRGLTAEVMHLRAMQSRLLALFDRLDSQLTEESGRAIAVARRVVASREMLTYDDYAEAMEVTRQTLHADGQCLGPRLEWHESAA
jgi:glycosyltransferase involved in cell wall biosynthesis